MNNTQNWIYEGTHVPLSSFFVLFVDKFQVSASKQHQLVIVILIVHAISRIYCLACSFWHARYHDVYEYLLIVEFVKFSYFFQYYYVFAQALLGEALRSRHGIPVRTQWSRSGRDPCSLDRATCHQTFFFGRSGEDDFLVSAQEGWLIFACRIYY